MRISRKRATDILSSVVALPLVGCHRTLDMESFLIGEYLNEPKGERRFFSPVVLQAECPWAFSCPGFEVVRSSEDDRNEKVADIVLRYRGGDPCSLRIAKVNLGSAGRLDVKFRDGCCLALQPAEYGDCWRVLRTAGTNCQFYQGKYYEFQSRQAKAD